MLHNVGVFYYTVNNVPQHFNSCFGNVYLLAVCNGHDLAVCGYDAVVEKFVHEIKHLSTVGINGEFPLLGHTAVYANLCHIPCDNLALNSLLGFRVVFWQLFCTLCYVSKDEIQTYFQEEQFTKRTVSEYNSDLLELREMLKQCKVHCRGVQRCCKLNDLDGFHVTDNCTLDAMHAISLLPCYWSFAIQSCSEREIGFVRFR